MTTQLPFRQFRMVPGQDIDPLFFCPLCHDSWADPVELVPCGDIFCSACLSAARRAHDAQPMIMENFQCPQCQTVVQSDKKPNRMLLNTVLELEVECQHCHWRGSRENSAQHTCEQSSSSPVITGNDRADSSTNYGTASSLFDILDAAQQQQESSGSAGSAMAPPPPPAELSHVSNTRPTGPPLRRSQDAPAPAPGFRGPRRAESEIDDAFTAIEDDPTSTMFREHSANQLEGVHFTGSSGSTRASGTLEHQTPSQLASSPFQPAANSLPTSTPTSRSGEPWRRYRLSQLEYDQLVGIYFMFDNGTGRLEPQQLRDLCFCMNFVQRDEDVRIIFSSMDAASKGYVTQDDFLMWLSTHRPDPSALFGLSQFEYTDALLQFRSVDPQYNGVIDSNDFCALCLTNGMARNAEEAMQLFRMCDDRNSGYVSLQQFLCNLLQLRAPAEARRRIAAGNPVVGGYNSGPTSAGQRSTNTPMQGSAGTQSLGGASSPPQYAECRGENSGARTSRTPPQPPQLTPPQQPRMTASQNVYPAELTRPRLALQQQQPHVQSGGYAAQPYSQSGRSTINASPQGASSTSGGRSERRQQGNSRLHRPNGRSNRGDEECAVL